MTKAIHGAALAALLVSAAPASAAIVDVVYTGTTNGGFDQYGAFIAGTVGQAYTASYRFDTSRGVFDSLPGPGWQLHGGTWYATTTPVLSATITIGSLSYNVSGASSGFASHFAGVNSISHIASYSRDTSVTIHGEELVHFSSGPNPPPRIDESYSADLSHDHSSYGYARIFTFNYASNQYSDYFQISLHPVTLTISPVVTAAVPEPATWAMMLIGFAGLSFVARRRKQDTPA